VLPAGLFYSEYAMADAIFPVIVLAWLLTTHSWLTAPTHRGRYLAAAASAALAGYSYSVHSRGMVIIAGYLVVLLIVVFWKKCRDSALLAAMVLVVTLLASWALNQKLKAVMYPHGPRSFTAQASERLGNLHGIILVLEMAIGQMWRFSLDSWGVAALGLAAVVVAIVRSRTPADARIIAGLALAITMAIAVSTPAALPSNQPQAWASGRYLDCMIVTFFLPGMVVLLRAPRRRMLIYAACVVPPTLIAAMVVDAYAGTAVPTLGFGAAFNFGEPAVLTQDWTSANVALATVVALGLLAVTVALAALLPARARAGSVLAVLMAISLAVNVDMTSKIGTANQAAARTADITPLNGLRQGEKIGISKALGWQIQIPQLYELTWNGQVQFNLAKQPPPAGITVVEVPWVAGVSEQGTWPNAPQGWHITSASQTAGWVVWQGPAQQQ
jgi:hypothetical protein